MCSDKPDKTDKSDKGGKPDVPAGRARAPALTPRTSPPEMKHPHLPNTRYTPPMARPSSKAPVGQGGRFAALAASLARKGVRDPKAVAAAIGRRKYGKKRFQQMAARGRREG